MPDYKEPGLLLDTHVWIWLVNGTPELTAETIRLIEAAAARGKLCIPVISVWEIATLVSKKRLTLRASTQSWVEEALSQPGVAVVPLSPRIAIESAQLPDGLHADPADRLIVATARVERLVLLTRDAKILAYAHVGHLQAIAV